MTTPAIPTGWAKFLSKAKISFLIFMVSFQKTIKTAPFGGDSVAYGDFGSKYNFF